MKELVQMLRDLRKDKKNNYYMSKEERKECFQKVYIILLGLLWAKISAPLVYPVWYLLRNILWTSFDETWKEIKAGIDINDTEATKVMIIYYGGKFIYWLWTYGDMNDPLGRGGLPERYGKATFWKRYKYSAWRNARFNWNYMELRTGKVIESETIIDTRNFAVMHRSDGIGDSPDGILFKWFRDEKGQWYFIYENNNTKHIWYFGWVGLRETPLGKNGRFEVSYRKTQFSYDNVLF